LPKTHIFHHFPPFSSQKTPIFRRFPPFSSQKTPIFRHFSPFSAPKIHIFPHFSPKKITFFTSKTLFFFKKNPPKKSHFQRYSAHYFRRIFAFFGGNANTSGATACVAVAQSLYIVSQVGAWAIAVILVDFWPILKVFKGILSHFKVILVIF
jgi:hypothetical protein